MGRIEYWLLGVVGALIAFIAVESVKSTLEPRRYALQIEQAGHPRDVPLEWETAGIPLRFQFPSDSTGADITVHWIEQFPPDELRIGKTRRLADQNGWVTHADVVVALHDRDGDSFPPGEISEILRHEIGHALGLGHSRNRATIMYPENTQLDLTELDKETLHLLYMLPPGKVK